MFILLVKAGPSDIFSYGALLGSGGRSVSILPSHILPPEVLVCTERESTPMTIVLLFYWQLETMLALFSPLIVRFMLGTGETGTIRGTQSNVVCCQSSCANAVISLAQ